MDLINMYRQCTNCIPLILKVTHIMIFLVESVKKSLYRRRIPIKLLFNLISLLKFLRE